MKRIKHLSLSLLILFFFASHLQAQAYRLDVLKEMEHPSKNRGEVKMPVYPTGTDEMKRFIEMFLIYPKDAVKNKIEGRVVVRFIVSKEGNINKITVVRGLSPSCDKEAIRVISIMPKWIPGEINKVAADIEYTLPIRFKFSESDETSISAVICDFPQID